MLLRNLGTESAVGRRFCALGHEGVDVNESNTRWIVGSATVALWVTTAVTAGIGLTMHWYLAIWLATAMASGGVLIYVADVLARARASRDAAGAPVVSEGAHLVCAAIARQTAQMETLVDRHAQRIESATEGHGSRMQADVFDLRHWVTNRYRGQALAQIDAAIEAERRSGSGAGPLPIISSGPR